MLRDSSTPQSLSIVLAETTSVAVPNRLQQGTTRQESASSWESEVRELAHKGINIGSRITRARRGSAFRVPATLFRLVAGED